MPGSRRLGRLGCQYKSALLNEPFPAFGNTLLNFVRDGSAPHSEPVEKELFCLVEVRLEAMAAKSAGEVVRVEGTLTTR
jgi:hypothetical protein